MVRVENVSKIFNKRRRNEIHAINNTSLEFNTTGIVALLGPSGCGKTTLLNAIGGLDKVNKGKIFINGEKITSFRSGKIDKIRNLNIGYIFQNYNLVEDKTVFDNIAMVLNMIGIKNKEEVKEKVDYALEVVGMYRYKNRYADMLSGGERQRVAIARAIVKNPAIIIADEPTGNLDSRNTLAIMNIIKKISEEKLVMLVTHETKLANFYADRIINIKDGQVSSDEENTNNSEGLDYRLENKVYLKDMPIHKHVEGDGYNFNIYKDEDEELDVNIVLKNGNLYIQCEEKENRMEVVELDSSIELVNQHYSEIKKEDLERDKFDPTRLVAKGKLKNASIFNIFTLMKNGFKTVQNYHPLKKVLLAGFFISAMFVLLSISNILGVLNIEDEKFVTTNHDYIEIQDKNITLDEYNQYARDPNIKYIMPGNSEVSFSVIQNAYLQTSTANIVLTGALSNVEDLTKKDIVEGVMPQNSQEIVVDKMAIEKEIKEEGSAMKHVGITKASDMIGKTISVPNMKDFIIVGVVDKSSPCIYTYEANFINIIGNSVDESMESGMYQEAAIEEPQVEAEPSAVDVNLKAENITLKKGRMPTNDYEAIVNISNAEEMPLNKEIPQKINEKKLKVVGYYESKYNEEDILVNSNTFKYSVILKSKNAMACVDDKGVAIKSYKEQGVGAKDVYAAKKEEYKSGVWDNILASIVMAAVVLLIAIIEIFLIMRASFLSRVKEVGTYRAIGVKKRDIYKMFIGEIIAITTVASLPGFAFMAYIIKELSSASYFSEVYIFNGTVLLVALAIIYVFNLLFGLIPVFNTLRKRPAAILARTDVN